MIGQDFIHVWNVYVIVVIKFFLFHEMRLQALKFRICKFHGNHDHSTRYIEGWLNLVRTESLTDSLTE